MYFKNKLISMASNGSVTNSDNYSDLRYTTRSANIHQPVDPSVVDYYAPYAVTFFSALSTLAAFYFIVTATEHSRKRNWKLRDSPLEVMGSLGRNYEKSTVLPGYGILGDRVNEFIELFLDTLAIYVHNDGNRDCPRRMLCEANQRAADYGLGYGLMTYLLSLSVSFMLRGQRVSESMEAMRRGRHGMDCKYSYPRCPFSL